MRLTRTYRRTTLPVDLLAVAFRDRLLKLYEKHPQPADDGFGPLPAPSIQPLTRPFDALITGIGGTGVITIGQILAAAAHTEGKGVTVLDMSGLAQKGGPVMSHLRVANSPGELHAIRVGTGGADLVLGCDLVVTGSNDALGRMNEHSTRVAVNSSEAPTAEFVRNPDWQLPGSDLSPLAAELRTCRP